MLLQEIKNIFHKELDVLYPLEEVNSFFYLMVEHYLGLERFVLALNPDMMITKEEEIPLFKGLAQLKLERPIQYILGRTHFMDLEFLVDEAVLIPRPETEELVMWALDTERGLNREINILDIGTGSGCIAVSLAKQLPKANVYAMDISREALEVAKQNAQRNDVTIEFMESDILSMGTMAKNFDIIISNPPYVRELEKKDMDKNVKQYEPHAALFVSNENPLVFYEHIAQFAKYHLNDGGVIYVETNQYLGKETRCLLEDHNFLKIETKKDMFGNHRMLKAFKDNR
ncbi:MAG: peptide chain release factor N(5)-glutamine methyltransferase [Saonia sp.]